MERRGSPWTDEDDGKLRGLLAKRWRTGDIAEALDRTTDAIRGRAQFLGLRLIPNIRPWRRPTDPE